MVRRIFRMLLVFLLLTGMVMPVLAEQADTAYQANESFELLQGAVIIPEDGRIRVVAGALIHLSLDANATTGYAWSCAIADETVITVIGEGYAMDSDTEPLMVGAGGKQHFFLSALAKGESEITLRYKQSWAENSSEDSLLTYAIVVE